MVVAGAADERRGSCRGVAGEALVRLTSSYIYGEEEEKMRVFRVRARLLYSGLLG